jgi:peptide-methionine (S)-S-oxide reductase
MEAIFQSLRGVSEVQQGWISQAGDEETFAEGIIVAYDEDVISLKTLIEIHLHTHSATSNHSMRAKYPSAVYAFSEEQEEAASIFIEVLQKDFDKKLITKALRFARFNSSPEHMLKYYYSDPEKPFCRNVISPKLRTLMEQFGDWVKVDV